MAKRPVGAKRSPQPDRKLLAFFTDNVAPGKIGLVGVGGVIGKLIRASERRLVPDHVPSDWNHCFIFGEKRADRRGPNGELTVSPYIYECAFDTNLADGRFDSGTLESWVGKWCHTDVEHAAIVDFNLTDDQRKKLLATALQLVSELRAYSVPELLGTFWAILTGHQGERNPLDDPRAMDCSSFVRHCFRAAGRDFMSDDVSVSNTTPEHIAEAAVNAGCLTRFR
jgi:hypothetical protein